MVITYLENDPLNQWLEQETPETVIEPQLPIVDPHHHLWDLRKYTTNPHARFLQKVYLCDEFSNDIHEGGHNIVQTVFAECHAFFRANGPEAILRTLANTHHQSSINERSSRKNRTSNSISRGVNIFVAAVWNDCMR